MMLGVSPDNADKFVGWCVRPVQGFPQPRGRDRTTSAADQLLPRARADRQATRATTTSSPTSSMKKWTASRFLCSHPRHLLLLLVAGIDTTWSSIGSDLWHLAQNRRTARVSSPSQPETSGVEELLRHTRPSRWLESSPPTSSTAAAREGRRPADHELPLPTVTAKVREPDQVILDRPANPHIAFGVGSTAAPAPTWRAWR